MMSYLRFFFYYYYYYYYLKSGVSLVSDFCEFGVIFENYKIRHGVGAFFNFMKSKCVRLWG
jgi:hypothetical protein